MNLDVLCHWHFEIAIDLNSKLVLGFWTLWCKLLAVLRFPRNTGKMQNLKLHLFTSRAGLWSFFKVERIYEFHLPIVLNIHPHVDLPGTPPTATLSQYNSFPCFFCENFNTLSCMFTWLTPPIRALAFPHCKHIACILLNSQSQRVWTVHGVILCTLLNRKSSDNVMQLESKACHDVSRVGHVRRECVSTNVSTKSGNKKRNLS